jgi:hypothetical protein
MSLSNYKSILIESGTNSRTVYFDGTGETPFALWEDVFQVFDVRINQGELADRNLSFTNDDYAIVDVQGLDAISFITVNLAETSTDPPEDYQIVFLEGDKIITGVQVSTGDKTKIPAGTTRIEVKAFDTSIKLPVRAKDIANDDGDILDTVPIAGVTGAIADRIQYMNDSGYLTELITTGTADFIQSVVSRPEFSAKQNNVPSKGQVLLFSYDGTGGLTDNYISGFTAGSAGKVIRVINVGSNTIVLSANDTGSTAGNRILGSNITLGQYEGATLIYIEDYTGTLPTTTIDGWIVVGRNN